MNLSLFSSRGTIGIDISSTTIKMLELSPVGSSYRVESYGVEPLPESTVVENEVKNIEALGLALKRCLRNSGCKARQAVIAVPDQFAVTKTLAMPKRLNEFELEDAVRQEAADHIPYSLDEVALDYQISGPWDRDPGMNEIQIVAAKQEQLDDRLAALRLAGLTPKVVDIESHSYVHLLPLIFHGQDDSWRQQPIAVFDIGATATVLTIIRDDHLIYTRTTRFGGKTLTEDIMRRYGMSYQDAGRAKRTGELPPDYEDTVMRPFLANLATQASRSLQIYLSTGSGPDATQVLLAGGCASIPQAEDIVREELGLPCQRANPFQHISIASQVSEDRLRNDALSMVVATGLAMRGHD